MNNFKHTTVSNRELADERLQVMVLMALKIMSFYFNLMRKQAIDIRKCIIITPYLQCIYLSKIFKKYQKSNRYPKLQNCYNPRVIIHELKSFINGICI